MSRTNYRAALLLSCLLLGFTCPCRVTSAKTFPSVLLLFSRQKDYDVSSLDNAIALTITTTQGAHNCVLACTTDARCVSALYEADTGSCRLLDVFLPPSQSSSPPVGWQLWQWQVSSCPADQGYTFSRDVGLCYRIRYDVTMSWQDANAACHGEGGHLVIVDSQEKQDFLTAELTKVEGVAERGSGYWTGYYMDAVYREGVWVWSSNNQALDFSAWEGNEDRVQEGAYQTFSVLSFRGSYRWASVAPSRSRPFICEVDVSKPDPSCH